MNKNNLFTKRVIRISLKELMLFSALLGLASLALSVKAQPKPFDSAALKCQSMESLPEPSFRRTAKPILNAEQELRAAEVQRYLARGYCQKGYQIVTTTQSYSGDIIDWVDARSIPGAFETPPPPITQSSLSPAYKAQMEIVAFPELRGPTGTIPIQRPNYDAYIFQDSGIASNRRAHPSIESFINNQQSGQPSGQFRLYGGYILNDSVTSAVSTFNIWNRGNIENGTFSLLEMAVFCDDGDDIVGATVSRDRANFGDPADAPTRLQIEIIRGGQGRWAQAPFSFWVPSASAPYGPGAAYSGESERGGSQVEARYEFQLFNGNWWFNHAGNWLGYYPASLLSQFPSGQGCGAAWYGEVYDPTPTNWTGTNMGSGLFAANGWAQAAYIREPFYVDGGGVSRWPDAAVLGGPTDAACYTTSNILNGGGAWDRYFYLGGPGGDSRGCD